MIQQIAFATIGGFIGLVAYAYVVYPGLLLAVRRRGAAPIPGAPLPHITILLAAYNEEAQIRGTIESLLALEYPPELKQILVVSDASSDRTDEIVRSFASRGVELVRLPERGGKTMAENAAAAYVRGEIVVNTDASVRIRPDALRPMIEAFADPDIGVVSGQDVSVSTMTEDANSGEGAYVGYEMWVRQLETEAGGIVGASGCFFAIRSQLQRIPAPLHLSRDFAAALVARENGMRAISMPASRCQVPRSTDIRAEFRRKVRTFTRGMETLHFKRHLMNPFRHGAFAWKLASHKLARWAIPFAALAAMLAIAVLAIDYPLARVAFALAVLVLIMARVGWLIATPEKPLRRWLALPTYVVVGNLAVLKAGLLAMRGERAPIWEPTRRPARPEPIEPVAGVATETS